MGTLVRGFAASLIGSGMKAADVPVEGAAAVSVPWRKTPSWRRAALLPAAVGYIIAENRIGGRGRTALKIVDIRAALRRNLPIYPGD
ncbi:hypothetical protein AB4124_01035 [Paenibacillus sp. 2KB_20]|uniref:hypothetical protein n=1 Tax=Paenibacillus TaxID=44249 RepID=UPI003D28B9AE